MSKEITYMVNGLVPVKVRIYTDSNGDEMMTDDGMRIIEKTKIELLLKKVESLTAALATAEEALQRYAVHATDCPTRKDAQRLCGCDACKAEDALAEIEKARGKV